MKFKYSARTKTGEMQAGFIEAINKESAFNTLSGHNLFILSLEAEAKKGGLDEIFSFLNRVKKKDLVIFTRQFATLLEAEIPLSDALKTLYAQTKNAKLKETIFEISSDIDAGLSLSQALERHGKVFSEFYINLIRSAEVTGRVQESMIFLADYLEKDMALMGRIRNALIYPAFVILLFIAVVGILLVVVFPQLKPIFEDTGVELPFVTKILLGSGDFLISWWWAIAAILGVGGLALIDYLRTEEGKIVLDNTLIKMPLLGPLFQKLYVARFAQSAQVLIKGGIPVAQAIEISGHTVDSAVYREALKSVADGVRRGELLSQAIASNTEVFPPLLSQMTAVGESTGRLDDMLDRIAIFYSREVDSTVGNLVELIQPAVMVAIGVMVGVLFAAVLLPIYDLAQGF